MKTPTVADLESAYEVGRQDMFDEILEKWNELQDLSEEAIVVEFDDYLQEMDK